MAKFNQNVYNHIKAVGGSEASAQNAARANKPGRALDRFLKAFTPPAPRQQSYATPSIPSAPRPAAQANATMGSVGKGVLNPLMSGGRVRNNLMSLFIRPNYKPREISSFYGGSFAGAGNTPNIGSFG